MDLSLPASTTPVSEMASREEPFKLLAAGSSALTPSKPQMGPGGMPSSERDHPSSKPHIYHHHQPIADPSQSILLQNAPEKLVYDIHSCSSHSPNYPPRNIMVNKPTDQSSRWSSNVNNPRQFLMIQLEQPAVVETITFGKYMKTHVCNLKEFKIFGGLEPENMIELLHGGVKNDTEPETFPLKYTVNNLLFPCRYIKIAPLMAYGPHFNFSIWYVELHGICNKSVMEKVLWDYYNYRETEVIRLCLKHFRQRNFMDVFDVLQQRTQLQLEDPFLTELHKVLVMDGNFQKAEEMMEIALKNELFEEYVFNSAYNPIWKKITFRSGRFLDWLVWSSLIFRSTGVATPCVRGGHQLCIDVERSRIYLFGGWDGETELADFWFYDINSSEWNLISMDTKKDGGPEGRSCHKICFDPSSKSIYVLGRYIDGESRPNVNLDNDFWRYDLTSGKWIKISGNTQAEGGPELLYDHQMVIDSAAHTMYVFGGITISPDASQVVYSGLYSYHIPTNRWQLLRADCASSSDHSARGVSSHQGSPSPPLRSRLGHSMLLNPVSRELYIFAGQRNKEYLSDLIVYDIDSETVFEVTGDYSQQGGPDAGFTQRATIDPELGEFYILSGLQRDRPSGANLADSSKNTFWCYNLRRGKWARVYHNNNVGADYWSKMKDIEPSPRYAHQLVFCPNRKVHYLFGGNPSDPQNPNMRLDDFWELHLLRPKPVDVFRRALFQIRRQQFRELCTQSSDPDSRSHALHFLQSQVAAVVDHNDEKDSKDFRQLTQHLLFLPQSSPTESKVGGVSPFNNLRGSHHLHGGMSGSVVSAFWRENDPTQSETYRSRTDLYKALVDFFPLSMREPKQDLINLI
ncbi:Muskelin N-terminus-domain-containing protein [Zopfochytrium polystomum]|nr:Muskelin N-terminus-domain-containing protein [Zopfochytrium polystomum]